MKKLALLGAARPNYQEKVKNVIDRNECGYCWSGWSYKINSSKEEILKKQDSFNIYIHDIKTPKDKSRGTGTGFVGYKLLVKNVNKNNYNYDDKLRSSPEPECTSSIDKNKPHRLYVKIFDEPLLLQRRKWNTFKDFDKVIPLSELKVLYPFRNPNADFLYIIDENSDC